MSRVSLFAFAAAALVIPVTACAPAEQPPAAVVDERPSEAEVRAAIAQMNDDWDTAVTAGDFGAAGAQYTEDAIRMQEDIPALVGREAILQWLQAESEQYTFEGANTIEEIQILGNDWAFVRGTAVFTRTPKAGGAAAELREKWLSILQRQPDGTWRWHRDAISSDIPRM